MKTIAPGFLSVLLLTSPALAQESIQPKTAERLSKLAQSYDAAVERAVLPLRKTYQGELEKMKTEFTKAGDLASALAADAAIKKLAQPAPAVAAVKTEDKTKPSNAPPALSKSMPLKEAIKLLPPPNRKISNRDVVKWVEGKVWRYGGIEWFRLDKGGTGARFTKYAGLEPNVKWSVDADGFLQITGGNWKYIRMTAETTGDGIMPSAANQGVLSFNLETNEIPELKK